MISALGTSEILFIVVIILIFFGKKDLPILMRKVATILGKLNNVRETYREEFEKMLDESRIEENSIKQNSMEIQPQTVKQEVEDNHSTVNEL